MDSMQKIEGADYDAEHNVDDIRAMLILEIAGVCVLYTRGYYRLEDGHLKAADIPPFRPGVVLVAKEVQ